MEKVRPWYGQPSDRGRLKNKTEQNKTRYAGEQIDRHADSHDCRNVGGVNINNLQHTIK